REQWSSLGASRQERAVERWKEGRRCSTTLVAGLGQRHDGRVRDGDGARIAGARVALVHRQLKWGTPAGPASRQPSDRTAQLTVALVWRERTKRHAQVVRPHKDRQNTLPEVQVQEPEGEQPAREPEQPDETVLLDPYLLHRKRSIERVRGRPSFRPQG